MDDTLQRTDQELDALRDIILGREKSRLSELDTKINDENKFAGHIGKALPEAFKQSTESSDKLAQAMVPTVENIVRLSIKKDINKFADALFPVIGPAIRKSIQETIRQMLQSMNQMLESTLSWQGLRWRLESIRTGIPFSQIVLLNGLVYRVEQVFLIHRETGVLLQHIERETSVQHKADAVSSMLTAIGDFVKDSFNQAENEDLGSIQVGGLAIWIEQGPDISLAVAINGHAPHNLRTTMQETIEAIQLQYAEHLAHFNGDTDDFSATQTALETCMVSQHKQPEKTSTVKPKLIAAVTIILCVYWLGTFIFYRQQQNKIVERLEQEPGYFLTKVEHHRKNLNIIGLKDPLSTDLNIILKEAQFDKENLSFDFQPYHSLEPEILVKRIRRLTQAPASVALSISDDTLILNGYADAQWLSEFTQLQRLIPGVSRVEMNVSSHFDLSTLTPPKTVTMEWQDDVLFVSGSASQAWITQFTDQISSSDIDVSYDTSNLTNSDVAHFNSLAEELESLSILFEVESSIPKNSRHVDSAVDLINSLLAQAQLLSKSIAFEVNGYSDSTGDQSANFALSQTRAEYIAAKFVELGIHAQSLTAQGMKEEAIPESTEYERALNRSVSIKVITSSN